MATETANNEEQGGAASGTIARLEGELQRLENSLTEGVVRHEKSLREWASDISSVEKTTLALSSRIERAEQEQAATVTALRSVLGDIRERLNGLDAGKLGGYRSPDPLSDPPHLDEPVALDGTNDEISNVSHEETQHVADEPTSMESYLSAARRAAKDAAASHQDRPARQESKTRGRSGRTRLILLGCAAPLVIVAVMVVVLNRHSVTAAPGTPRTVLAPSPPAFVLPAPPQVVDSPAPDPSPTGLASATPVDELEKKAETGDPNAEREIGLKYLVGNGINLDEAVAANWLLQAAYKGDPTAEYWLGSLYADGRGVPADMSQSNHWYEAAAKQGNRRAMHSLGVANFEGRGMDKNSEEAARWFTKAAELGFGESQFNLAVLYEQGDGVAPSRAQAYKWYAIAAAHGDEKANARVAELAKALPPAELDAARHEAAAFKPAPIDESANAGDVPPPSGG